MRHVAFRKRLIKKIKGRRVRNEVISKKNEGGMLQ